MELSLLGATVRGNESSCYRFKMSSGIRIVNSAVSSKWRIIHSLPHRWFQNVAKGGWSSELTPAHSGSNNQSHTFCSISILNKAPTSLWALSGVAAFDRDLHSKFWPEIRTMQTLPLSNSISFRATVAYVETVTGNVAEVVCDAD